MSVVSLVRKKEICSEMEIRSNQINSGWILVASFAEHLVVKTQYKEVELQEVTWKQFKRTGVTLRHITS